jgi:catechol 2,3-dioxygenase-like lactoylglutathione lyase family enzyme
VTVELNHTIVTARDKRASAEFLAHMLGLEAGAHWGPFVPVQVANGVTLDYIDANGAEIHPQHYAFLVSEAEFDDIYGRIVADGVAHWADPHQSQPAQINHHDGGRGVYFADPDGHLMEAITRPYGSGALG